MEVRKFQKKTLDAMVSPVQTMVELVYLFLTCRSSPAKRVV